MSKTIAQLYRGNLDPIRFIGNGNGEMKRTETLIERNFDKLQETLDENAKEALEKYNECMKEYIVLISEQSFCDGFCLGTRISAEAIGGAERVLQNI